MQDRMKILKKSKTSPVFIYVFQNNTICCTLQYQGYSLGIAGNLQQGAFNTFKIVRNILFNTKLIFKKFQKSILRER